MTFRSRLLVSRSRLLILRIRGRDAAPAGDPPDCVQEADQPAPDLISLHVD